MLSVQMEVDNQDEKKIRMGKLNFAEKEKDKTKKTRLEDLMKNKL